MIYIGSIGNPNIGHSDVADEVWAIVRSDKRVPSWMKHVPELSPSWELFKQYLTWRDCGHWNKDTFEREYVPRFLDEFKNGDSDLLCTLAYLKELDQSGKNIWLVCFCADETMCHRSIVAGILQGLGFNVAGNDYSKYYNMITCTATKEEEQHSTVFSDKC